MFVIMLYKILYFSHLQHTGEVQIFSLSENSMGLPTATRFNNPEKQRYIIAFIFNRIGGTK